MANTYSRVNLAGTGGGSGTAVPPYLSYFDIGDWVLNGDNYEITLLDSIHDRGPNVVVEVSEKNGTSYEQIGIFTTISEDGDIVLRVANDNRFEGRIILISG